MKLEKAIRKYLRHLEKQQFSESHTESVRGRLNRFAKIMGEGAEITAVRKNHISIHFAAMKKSGLADGTLAGHKSTNRAFWNYAKKRGWVRKNPSKILVGNKRHRYSFEPVHSQAAPVDDFATVLNSLPSFVSHRHNAPRDVRDALIVSMIADSAARRGAVWAISRRAAVRALKRGRRMPNGETVYTIILQADDSKTGRSKIRFFQQTAALLKNWLTLMPANATHICCNLRDGKQLARENVSQPFIRICEFANVPTFRSHAIRKRVVTDVIAAAGDPKAGQLYAGHKSPRTTQQYYNQLEDDEVDVMAATLARRRLKNAENNDDLAKSFFSVR